MDKILSTISVLILLPIAFIGLACPAAQAASEAHDQLSTVNSYTPAQEAAARLAATRAGYSPGPVLFAQAGNFFFNSTKAGHAYTLTVTPDGKVYASTPEN